MKKFLMVAALGIASFGLIIGAIFGAVNLNETGIDSIKVLGFDIGIVVAMFFGGIGCGVAAIANFFTTKVKTKNEK